MYGGAKAVFYFLSRSRTLKSLASTYGMRTPESFARRFIAGHSVDEAIPVARSLAARRLSVTLDYLGESVRTFDEAAAAARQYVSVMDALVAAGVERNVSLKLTQLGAGVDRATCLDNLRRILDRAQRDDVFVWIDMENSPWTQLTLDTLDTAWQLGHRQVGVALQAALRRSDSDLAHLIDMGVPVRLVKGAYKEPASAAYQQKAEVDEAFLRLMTRLLEAGTRPAIATHDPAMITATRARAEALGLTADRFEFQMLYGIRRDLQTALTDAGLAVRIYLPFGTEWFPYFMRRLGERPANVGFVLRSLLHER
jgi:proline dehydrogenase